MADLRITKELAMEKTDARWLQLTCDEDCVRIEALYVPAAKADQFVAALREAHARLHNPNGD